MEYAAFQETLQRIGLSGRAFARLLNLNPNSITNYKKTGSVPAHLAVILSLIAALKEAGGDYEAAIAEVEIPKKAARGRTIRKSSLSDIS
jgi:hypothetical protein